MLYNLGLDDSDILQNYPLPIAHEYRELLQIDETHWQARNQQLVHVVEYTIRYCTIVALNEYEQVCADRPPSTTDKAILKQLSNPRIKGCLAILEAVLREMRLMNDLFMPELQAFCMDGNGVLTDDWHLMESLSGLAVWVGLRSPADENPHRELYQESIGRVSQLLRRLAFVKKYTLVRLIKQAGENGRWLINDLVGADINRIRTSEIALTITLSPLTLGLWAPETSRFLQLSPYALFQRCEECYKRDKLRDNDFFLYERREAGRSIYVGLENTHGSPHHISLDDFVEDQINRLKQEAAVALQTWADFARKMQERTSDQLARLGEKYQRRTYTQREALEGSFVRFMRSSASGFLIVGDSGVGKTNQMCYLAGQCETVNHDIVILENCAAWDASAVAGLDEFLATRYGYSLDNSWVKALKSLHAQSPDHPTLIVFLDAVNEYCEPHKLLDALYNQILVPMRDLAWFRIVISCRTESWKRLEGGFQAERLFFGSSEEGVVHWLRWFAVGELSKAYANYKDRYSLLTNFEDLSEQARRFIAYPLMLRLVAESSIGQAVPSNLRSQVIFKKYVELKIGEPDPNLAAQDRRQRMIVDRFIDLMTKNKQDFLDKAQLFADDNIGQFVYDGSIGSPYVRLLDKGVLLEVGQQAGPVAVRFAYDQILEYLLAQHLLPADLHADAIVGLSRQSMVFPSLWGAARLALLMRQSADAAHHLSDDPVLIELAYRDEYVDEQSVTDEATLTQVRGLLVEMLTTWGQESPIGLQQVSDFASELITANQESPGLLAVELVHQLGLNRLLEMSACSPVAYVRQLATLYIFFLFQQGDGQEGVNSFRNIRDTVKQQFSLRGLAGVAVRFNQGMDSVRGLHALLDLCLLTIPLGYRYPAVVRPVGEMLVEFLNSVPLVIQSAIGSVLASYGVDLITSIITSGNQLAKMRPFFDRPLNDPFREKVARLMGYFDPEAGSLDGELGDLILDVGHETDMFAYLMIVQVLMTRVGPRFSSLYHFCRRLYTEGNDHCKHIALRVFTLINHIERRGAYWQPEHAAFAKQMVLELARFGVAYPWKPDRNGTVTLKPIGPLDELEGTCHSAYVILNELEERRSGALELILQIRELPWELPESRRTAAIMYALYDGTKIGIATTRLNILPVLETIQPYFGVTNHDEQEAVADALLRLRSFFPTEVDTYLLEAPRWLRLRIQSDFRPTPLGSISNGGMQWGVPWLFITTPVFRQSLADLLAHVARTSKDVDSDIHTMARRILTIPMIKAISQALANAKAGP